MTHWHTRRVHPIVMAAALGVGLCLAAAGCANGDGSTGAGTTATPAPSSATAPATATAPPATTSPSSTVSAALKLDTVTDNQGKYAVVASAGGAPTQTQTLNDKLIIAENGCFHATGRNGPPTLLIFPAGTTISANGKPAIMLDGKTLPVGSPINLTGESVTLSQENSARAKPCVARGDVFRITGAAE